jgi:hypothetical protein
MSVNIPTPMVETMKKLLDRHEIPAGRMWWSRRSWSVFKRFDHADGGCAMVAVFVMGIFLVMVVS